MEKEMEQISQDEEEQLKCPECGKEFKDLRGLTSHARHKHDLEKDQLIEQINKTNDESSVHLKIIAGLSAILITLVAVLEVVKFNLYKIR